MSWQSSVCSESTKKGCKQEKKNSHSGNVNIVKHWRLICILGLFWVTADGNWWVPIWWVCTDESVLLFYCLFPSITLLLTHCVDLLVWILLQTHIHINVSPRHEGLSSLQQIFMKWSEEIAALHSSAASATPQRAHSHFYLLSFPSVSISHTLWLLHRHPLCLIWIYIFYIKGGNSE